MLLLMLPTTPFAFLSHMLCGRAFVPALNVALHPLLSRLSSVWLQPSGPSPFLSAIWNYSFYSCPAAIVVVAAACSVC